MGNDIADLKLIPSSGGRFEVTVNGDLIWSKKETKQFPEYDFILGKLRGA